MMKQKTYIPLILILLLMLACDKVTNNYYTEDSEPTQTPGFEPGEWLAEVHSLCYYGLLDDGSSLYPGWLLQADGVRRAYSDSEFAQKFITDDMGISMRNPGAGTRFTLRMDESPVCHAAVFSATVPEGLTDELIHLTYPVKWNIDTLLHWHADKPVELAWTLLLEGDTVDHFTQQFNCRSLHCYIPDPVLLQKENQQKINLIKQSDFGSYPVRENDEVLCPQTGAFLMGYIDEHSALVEQLKKEILNDGYLPTISGMASPNSEQLLNSTARAFTYLMMKHRIFYTVSDGGQLQSPNYTADVQYIRTIDDIFHNQQGYCMELSAAFASWCINQGVKCTVEFVPGHAVNRLYDREGKAYPVDLTMLASSMAQFPILSDSPGATDFANVDRFYTILMTRSQQDEINTYQQGRQDDPVNYSTIDVYRLRQWLPSFNIGGNYLHTRAAAVEEDALQIVENPVWNIDNNLNFEK